MSAMPMNAIEFNSVTHNGMLDLPPQYQNWNGRRVRVILLSEEHKTSQSLKNRDVIAVLLKDPKVVDDATPLSRAAIYDR